MYGEGAHYVYCTPKELEEIVDLDKQRLRHRKEPKKVYRLGANSHASRRIHAYSQSSSPLINDEVNAKGEIQDVVRAAKYKQERKDVQDSLLFGIDSRGLRRACGDISVLRTTEAGSQPIEKPESYYDMYDGAAGRSASIKTEKEISRKFLKSRDGWLDLMDEGVPTRANPPTPLKP